DFEGTVLVVSHDREFLDNVADSVLAIGPDGVVEEFVGGWSDWKRQQDERDAKTSGGAGAKSPEPRPSASAGVAAPATSGTTSGVAAPPTPAKRKLSYKEQKE